ILAQQCEQDNLFFSGIRNAGCIHDEDIAAAGWSERFLPTGSTEETTFMARQRQETNGWPTIMWIAWREGETEHLEHLCRTHREHVFQHHAASAYGLGRQGDRCSFCRS